MAQDETSDDLPLTALEEELQTKLKRLWRRQNRNKKVAWADGFLTGICAALRPGDIAIDLGANIGDVSERLLATGADVIAFDPEPWAVSKLQARFKDHSNYTLYNAAVGVEDGQTMMFRAEDFDGNETKASVMSTIVSGGRMIDYEADAQVEVKIIDFVTFLQDIIQKRGKIAFVKMDIEGAEVDLLRAMHKADLFDHIGCCIVETHEHKFKDLRPDYRKLRADFAEWYRPEHVNLDWI